MADSYYMTPEERKRNQERMIQSHMDRLRSKEEEIRLGLRERDVFDSFGDLFGAHDDVSHAYKTYEENEAIRRLRQETVEGEKQKRRDTDRALDEVRKGLLSSMEESKKSQKEAMRIQREALKDRRDFYKQQEKRSDTLLSQMAQERMAEQQRQDRLFDLQMQERDRLRGIDRRRDDLISEVRSGPSLAREATRQALDQGLRNQQALASTLPTRAGGSASRQLLEQSRMQNQQLAQSSALSTIQEQNQKNALVGNLLGAQQGGVLASSGILGGLQRTGLGREQTAISATSPAVNISGLLSGQGTASGALGSSYFGQGIQSLNTGVNAGQALHQNAFNLLQFDDQKRQRTLDRQQQREQASIEAALGATSTVAKTLFPFGI